MNYLVLTLIVCMQHVCKSNGYYYWKDYYGKIPIDAFKAGQTINNENVYIGQGLRVKIHPGIYPTSIVEGKDTYVPMYGAHKPDNFIQILCSTDPANFEWIPANSTHLHVLKTDNKLVRGGMEINFWINIGRLKYQGGTVVGKVISGYIGGADMCFIHNGQELKAQSYEVLTYNDIASLITVRNS